jgi:hypothetical protein
MISNIFIAITNVMATVYASAHFSNTLISNIAFIMGVGFFLAIFITIAKSNARTDSHYALFFSIAFAVYVNRAK